MWSYLVSLEKKNKVLWLQLKNFAPCFLVAIGVLLFYTSYFCMFFGNCAKHTCKITLLYVPIFECLAQCQPVNFILANRD